MTLLTAVIDTANWRLAIPIESATPVDFSDTRLTVALAPIRGGVPIVTADSDDGTLTFVQAAGSTPAYFALDLPVKSRTWRISTPTEVAGDILRYPDPADPESAEWLGRVRLKVLPGSSSVAIAAAPGFAPVLIDAQPYDGRIVASALTIGPQGIRGEDGSSGAGAATVFTQASPSASWAIPHTFGRLPSVSVYDATGAELLADVTATSTAVSVVFAQATAGSAILT